MPNGLSHPGAPEGRFLKRKGHEQKHISRKVKGTFRTKTTRMFPCLLMEHTDFGRDSFLRCKDHLGILLLTASSAPKHTDNERHPHVLPKHSQRGGTSLLKNHWARTGEQGR